MNLEHNKEVQLMAPPQMWGRHGGVGLGAEGSHQDGPEFQGVPGRATEKPFPSSTPAAQALAELEGRLPGPAMPMAGDRTGTGVGPGRGENMEQHS